MQQAVHVGHGGFGNEAGFDTTLQTGWPHEADLPVHPPAQPMGGAPAQNHPSPMMMMMAAAAAAAATVAGGFGPGNSVPPAMGQWPVPSPAQFPPFPHPQQQPQQPPRQPPPLPPGYAASANYGGHQHLAPGGGSNSWPPQPGWY